MEKGSSAGSRFKAAFVGHKDKSTGEVHGGMFTGAQRGFQTGQKVEQTSQAIRQGQTPQFVKDQKWLKELRERTGETGGSGDHAAEPGASAPDNNA